MATEATGMVDLRQEARVPWCLTHKSFQVNIPSQHDGGSCWEWEQMFSESHEPYSLDLDCDFTTATVLVPANVRSDPHAGGA